MRACSVEGCSNPYRARGWCNRHYQYFQRKGVEPTVRLNTQGLPIRERMQTFFTKGEGCWLWTGVMSNGYGQIRVREKMRQAHALMYELEVGAIPKGLFIDHQCRTRNCVNPEHLRLATNKQNLENLSGANSSNGTSGVRGVSQRKGSQRWFGQVCHNYQQHYVGTFATIQEAEAAVIAKRNELFSHNELDRKSA